MTPKSDELILVDVESFEVFYITTVKRTLAYAQRMARNWQVAEEATQEAYIAVAKHWRDRQDRTDSENLSYVIKITRNKIADHYRHNERLSPLEDEHDPPAVGADCGQLLDQRVLFKAVIDVLESQAEKSQAVGYMYFIDGFEVAEIAEALEVKASTVRTQVQRLRTLLIPLACRHIELTEGGQRS
jgi:RNA polymerase sigma factor (sigma-70 family)